MESLFVKVALLLTMSMLGGAAGTWCGRNIRSGGTMIGLGITFVLGTIGVFFAAHAGAADTSLMLAVDPALVRAGRQQGGSEAAVQRRCRFFERRLVNINLNMLGTSSFHGRQI